MATEDPILELITSVIPTDERNGTTIIDVRERDGESYPVWGDPSALAALILDALIESGRLLPSGGEVSTQTLWPRFGDSGLRRQRVIVWPDGSRYFGPPEPHPVLSDNSSEVPND